MDFYNFQEFPRISYCVIYGSYRVAMPYTIKSFSVIIETNINRFVLVGAFMEELVENE